MRCINFSQVCSHFWDCYLSTSEPPSGSQFKRNCGPLPKTHRKRKQQESWNWSEKYSNCCFRSLSSRDLEKSLKYQKFPLWVKTSVKKSTWCLLTPKTLTKSRLSRKIWAKCWCACFCFQSTNSQRDEIDISIFVSLAVSFFSLTSKNRLLTWSRAGFFHKQDASVSLWFQVTEWWQEEWDEVPLSQMYLLLVFRVGRESWVDWLTLDKTSLSPSHQTVRRFTRSEESVWERTTWSLLSKKLRYLNWNSINGRLLLHLKNIDLCQQLVSGEIKLFSYSVVSLTAKSSPLMNDWV